MNSFFSILIKSHSHEDYSINNIFKVAEYNVICFVELLLLQRILVVAGDR